MLLHMSHMAATEGLGEVWYDVSSEFSAVEGDRGWVGLSVIHLVVMWTHRVQVEHVWRTT